MSVWIELRLRADANLAAVYRAIDAAPALSCHHFYEPWHEDGSVVRVSLETEKLRDTFTETVKPEIDHWVDWDAGPDERLFKDNWPIVADFFEASSRLAVAGIDTWTLHKVTHCHLNANGLDVEDEIKWAKRFIKGRKWVKRGQKAIWYRRILGRDGI